MDTFVSSSQIYPRPLPGGPQPLAQPRAPSPLPLAGNVWERWHHDAAPAGGLPEVGPTARPAAQHHDTRQHGAASSRWDRRNHHKYTSGCCFTNVCVAASGRFSVSMCSRLHFIQPDDQSESFSIVVSSGIGNTGVSYTSVFARIDLIIYEKMWLIFKQAHQSKLKWSQFIMNICTIPSHEFQLHKVSKIQEVSKPIRQMSYPEMCVHRKISIRKLMLYSSRFTLDE